MRVVIDMQGAQTASRFRGIGRYTLSFIQAVIEQNKEHEILLVLNGLFPETIEPIRAAFNASLPEGHILVWQAPGPLMAKDSANLERHEAAELIREAFIRGLDPDVVHVTSLFEGYVDDAAVSIGLFDQETPVSSVLYDLIPLLNPDKYLADPAAAAFYHRRLRSLRQARSLLAISDYSRLEGIEHLPEQAERIVNMSSAIDSRFQVIDVDEHTRKSLLQRLGVSRPFVMYTGGGDERKNLARLIEAWALLPAKIRATHQLLFAGKLFAAEMDQLRETAIQAHLADDELILTGYITDEELVQLYNLCRLFVFPSWHEGFGLPALEAMACGAPVIGSSVTSLPEVINLPDALFDPLDIHSMAAKMLKVLENGAFLQRLREHGLRQARNFSWDRTADRALSCWESIARKRSTGNPSWKLRLEHHHENQQALISRLVRMDHIRSSDKALRELATAMAANEQQTLGFLRSRELPTRISWRVEGPFDSSYSLALVNREIARALSEHGHDVSLHSTEGPGDYEPDARYLQAYSDLTDMHRRAAAISPWDADIVSRNLYPPRVTDMTCKLNSLHAYGWEESGFPLRWVDDFNLSLQGMTVMSEHVRKVMVDHGVTVPVVVSSLGVDHWERISADPNLSVQARAFRFLHVSSCFPRKGADVMLRAYGRAFTGSDDVTLIIKTFPNPHNQIHEWLEDVRASHPDYPDVQVIEDDYSDEQMKALYEQCDVLVAPSRAEGFGLPMAEAMLSGLGVITTGWSGQTDFCTEETAWLVDYRFERARTHFGISASAWAEPLEEHLSELMALTWRLPETERQAKAKAGRQLLMERFRWTHTASRMEDAARAWSVSRPKAPTRTGWISTWNTKCGIASYSQHLIDCMPGDVTVLAADTHPRVGQDGDNVHRCWVTGDTDTLEQLAKTIDEQRLDTLVIQFNYGFFEFSALSGFLMQQIGAGRKVVMTLHATTDPAHVPHKKLADLVPALRLCSRLLVHSINDLNRLKHLGLERNVTLFPLGILDFPVSPAPGITHEPFVIGAYGFLLPHKGLPELVDAAHQLIEGGMHLRVRLINAEYPAPESADLKAALTAQIARLQVQEHVTLRTDFLSDEESLRALAKCDLIVFPYQATSESASAAVRYGIASGRPVATTPLAIFDDVSAATFQLPGTTPGEIAQGIRSIAETLKSDSEQAKAKVQQAEHWRAEHRYSSLGPRLRNLLTALQLQG